MTLRNERETRCKMSCMVHKLSVNSCGRVKSAREFIPIPSTYGIFTYILMVNVGKYTIRGWCGIDSAWHKVSELETVQIV